MPFVSLILLALRSIAGSQSLLSKTLGKTLAGSRAFKVGTANSASESLSSMRSTFRSSCKSCI
uniref:Glycosyltransferase n=1 Tax=Rhizophora mucronata TaxID=61149 RepID=A0A2P2MJD8_RHIMU